MSNKMNKIIAGAFAASMVASASAPAFAGKQEGKEKCYGVVKAGKNMCGSADGKHSCMGHATEDGSPNEWIYLPEGVCEKLVGGSLEGGKGGAKEANSCDKNGCDHHADEKNSCEKNSCEKNSCDKNGCQKHD